MSATLSAVWWWIPVRKPGSHEYETTARSGEPLSGPRMSTLVAPSWRDVDASPLRITRTDVPASNAASYLGDAFVLTLSPSPSLNTPLLSRRGPPSTQRTPERHLGSASLQRPRRVP